MGDLQTLDPKCPTLGQFTLPLYYDDVLSSVLFFETLWSAITMVEEYGNFSRIYQSTRPGYYFFRNGLEPVNINKTHPNCS